MLVNRTLLTEFQATIERDASGRPSVTYRRADTGELYARFETNKFGDLVGTRGRAAVWDTYAIVPSAVTATNDELYKQTRAALAMRMNNCELL